MKKIHWIRPNLTDLLIVPALVALYYNDYFLGLLALS